jgi:hypothetical protein
MEEKRSFQRFPYGCPMNFMAMGQTVSLPDTDYASGEIINISDGGMKIKVEGRAFEGGRVLLVRVPIKGIKSSVPTLAKVQWAISEETGVYEAGLKFVV